MRFAPTEEQAAMRYALRELLADVDSPAVTRAWARGDAAPGLAVWRRLADLGVTGALVPEASGGLGLSEVELVLVLDELGYAGLPGPYVESLAVVPVLLAGRDEPGRLAAVAEGRAVATALLPPRVPRALDADRADVLVRGSTAEIALVGGSLTLESSVDGARRLFLVDGPAVVVAEGAAAGRVVDAAFDGGALGCAAQLLGVGRRLLAMAVRHAGQRRQFGRPIGAFQAVQHQLADVLLRLEFAGPLVRGAAVALRDGTPFAARDVSSAKLAAGEAANAAARTALQVHGAIGYTAEHELHLWLAKARALRSAWGTPGWHRDRVAASLATGATAPIGAVDSRTGRE
ncbi:acyl-CoA dehydrogenase [Solihabitans fulvus]|uniref:Acyl-CoA dehydrogenase n=1 Tax=Solihabitans fulvus TaxID=1892852 RepID=A0A5B2WRK4_9PSEU|nr:acyl-CoA dehydrogenase family protein [Solihabitans fulvus]KAA2252597.1 acyl-CoA dehydrogenase [Solihabitans fulvus]